MSGLTRAEREVAQAAGEYKRAERERDNAREYRDWILWEHSDALTRKEAAAIVGLSVPGVSAAIKRGKKLADESAAS